MSDREGKHRILIVHGPNLNLLGEREPDIYGTMTLKDIDRAVQTRGADLGVDIECFQSNHEGELIDYLHNNRKTAQGVIINPGALTHYSYALRDALTGVQLPAVEVHLSDIHKREEFRKRSVTRDACIDQVYGKGLQSYLEGLEILVSYLNRN